MSEAIPLFQSVVFVLFVIGFYFSMTFGETSFDQVWPASIYVTLALPVLGMLLTLAGFYYQYLGWANAYGTINIRLKNLVVMIASIVFLAVLNYWNALGWKL